MPNKELSCNLNFHTVMITKHLLFEWWNLSVKILWLGRIMFVVFKQSFIKKQLLLYNIDKITVEGMDTNDLFNH